MNKGSINIENTRQNISISSVQISGKGGTINPTIVIPIEFELYPIRNWTDKIKPIDLILLKGELYAESGQKIGEYTKITSHKISNQFKYFPSFEFSIPESTLSKIEKDRNVDVKLHIDIHIQVGIYNQMENDDLHFISGFANGETNIQFTIEQSQWVNKILPALGYNSIKLIELPAFNNIIPDEYEKSLIEFEYARKYFTNGDYDKTVSHCRTALEPFKINLAKLKEFVKSKSEFTWATTVLESTEEWLDKVIKATSAFTSKPHHVPSVGHFSRTDAEIVLLITTGIIAYIGKIGYKPE